MEINYADFSKIELHVGTVINAEPFPEARKPAYKLTIDFGEKGILKSSAQITDFYTLDNLKGKQIIAVLNFPKKQIANFISECLVLASVNQKGQAVLLKPDFEVENGLKIA